MAHRRLADPKVLLPLAAVALVVFSAIAIFVAVGHSPRSGSGSVSETPALTVQPAPAPR